MNRVPLACLAIVLLLLGIAGMGQALYRLMMGETTIPAFWFLVLVWLFPVMWGGVLFSCLRAPGRRRAREQARLKAMGWHNDIQVLSSASTEAVRRAGRRTLRYKSLRQWLKG